MCECEHTCQVLWADLQDVKSELEEKIEDLRRDLDDLRDQL